MTALDVVFAAVALVVLASAVLTVTSRNVVHAALWLVVTLGGVAAAYLLLTAELVAWVQIIIYVGAVVVLLLFASMLTRAPLGPSPDANSGLRVLAAVAGVATAAALGTLLWRAFGSAYTDLRAQAQGSLVHNLGLVLFRNWVLPFELASVLLLAALVGAVVISRRPAESEG